MLKHAILPLAFALAATTAVQANTAPCLDAKGKPVKCAPKPPAPACKDAQGRPRKCDAPEPGSVAKTTIVKSKSNITNN
jgi:hypothetical protein